MKILLTGAGGQVGWEITRQASARGLPVDACTRQELNIAEPHAVQQAMNRSRPDLVINAAAYTRVDQAESEPDHAFQANRTGPALLADCCNAAGIPIIHISTDYVFDGQKKSPYTETDPLSPLGIYGQSKAEGETEVRRRLDRHLIIRTAWVYGVHGANFVKTMLRLGREREHLRVVDDQFGSPTAAGDIAAALLTLAERIRDYGEVNWGTYHYCGNGNITWRRFAVEVFRIAKKSGYPASPEIEAIPTSEYPTPVKRPAFSVLDTTKIAGTFGIHPRPWQESLAEVIKEIMVENKK